MDKSHPVCSLETLIYHISRYPNARQGTVSDALQNVPGVKVGQVTIIEVWTAPTTLWQNIRSIS